jgi:hypothetical protein
MLQGASGLTRRLSSMISRDDLIAFHESKAVE